MPSPASVSAPAVPVIGGMGVCGCSASMAGVGEDGARVRYDMLLRAITARADASTVEQVGIVVRQLLAFGEDVEDRIPAIGELLEAGFDHLRDRRTRHQGAMVGFEAQAGKPGLTGQVAGWHALIYPALKQGQHALLFFMHQFGLAIGRAQIMRQMQGMQHKLRGFIERIVVAMTETQAEIGRAHV